MEDFIMDLRSYKEACIGGLNPIDEVEEEIKEMQDAPIGKIKPQCWEKIGADEFVIFAM